MGPTDGHGHRGAARDRRRGGAHPGRREPRRSDACGCAAAGTKPAGAAPTADADLELRHGAACDEITEHNRGDLTAVLQAGVPLATAQAQFAAGRADAGPRPTPRAPGRAATIGGVVATADSGPLRHRYGAPRDLVIGVTVALADGTIAKSGGKVIKNVAGYDLAKLLRRLLRHAGADPLGQRAPASAARRRHDRARRRRRSGHAGRRRGGDGGACRSSSRPSTSPGAAGRGGLLMRCAGPEHARRAGRAARRLTELGLDRRRHRPRTTAAVGAPARRPAQRATAALVRVAAPPAALGRRAAGHRRGRRHPGRPRRAGHQLRRARARRGSPSCARRCPPPACRPCSTRPPRPRAEPDPWGELGRAALTPDARRQERALIPTGRCNPGLFVGGHLAWPRAFDAAFDAHRPRAGGHRRLRALRLLPGGLPDLSCCGARRPTPRAGGSCSWPRALSRRARSRTRWSPTSIAAWAAWPA